MERWQWYTQEALKAAKDFVHSYMTSRFYAELNLPSFHTDNIGHQVFFEFYYPDGVANVLQEKKENTQHYFMWEKVVNL